MFEVTSRAIVLNGVLLPLATGTAFYKDVTQCVYSRERFSFISNVVVLTLFFSLQDNIMRNFTSPIKFGRRRRRSVEFDGVLSPLALLRERRASSADILTRDSRSLSGDEFVERFRRSSGLSAAVANEVFFTRSLKRVTRAVSWGGMDNITLENLPGNVAIKVYVRILNTLFAGPARYLMYFSSTSLH